MTQKQMMTAYWIVDCSLTSQSIIDRIGKAKYDYYYPIYKLIKSPALKNWYNKRYPY